ncbi:Putative preQ0 transporter YhhQ [hydrothermal vent metagenome]|uniref:PreQ0 transporter YhhQ n=1 Tax=hydrothermal vent metagenome TaxID=652676 RepID=A0A3B0SAX2_9ZZZZ
MTTPHRIPLRSAQVLALLTAAYVSAQLLADITSLRIVDIAGSAMDGGTLVYPITFTLRDLVHKVAGKRVARTLIFASAVINIVMAGLFWIVTNMNLIPDTGPQSELFGDVLGPVWRIVFASIIAEVISELVDTEVYSRWVKTFGERLQWGRVLSSNAVSIPIDTVIFVAIAFGGVFSGAVLVDIVRTNIVIKGIVTIASIPLIYMVKPGRVVDDQELVDA